MDETEVVHERTVTVTEKASSSGSPNPELLADFLSARRAPRRNDLARVPVDERMKALAPLPLIDLNIPYELDRAAQRFVDEHPNGPGRQYGATLEEIGEATGRTRERIRQIEYIARRRLARRFDKDILLKIFGF